MEPWLERFARANFARSGDTAHDLKTPLNVAVLNLELLRMRVRKLTGGDDEKLLAQARSLEVELRRMARIFDTFFILSTPPATEGAPPQVDMCPLCSAEAEGAGHVLSVAGPFRVVGHESRLRQALKLFFEGTARLLEPDGRQLEASANGQFEMSLSGRLLSSDTELSKVFKFYFSDVDGNPDVALAAARLIVETYGGSLEASRDHDKVVFRMTFPPGES